MNKVNLQWATPNIDKEIMYMARVSNPKSQDSENIKLLYYCMREGHVSPFDMANVCMEVNTTRDIARQILRHKSFFFQEFSQRYADATLLGDFAVRECRMQDVKNRQNSIETDDFETTVWWAKAQNYVTSAAELMYSQALERGIAKEQARAHPHTDDDITNEIEDVLHKALFEYTSKRNMTIGYSAVTCSTRKDV